MDTWVNLEDHPMKSGFVRPGGRGKYPDSWLKTGHLAAGAEHCRLGAVTCGC